MEKIEYIRDDSYMNFSATCGREELSDVVVGIYLGLDEDARAMIVRKMQAAERGNFISHVVANIVRRMRETSEVVRGLRKVN